MSTLRLRIHKNFDEQQQPPQIYVRISAVTKTGARKKTEPVLQELVPVSDRPETAKSIPVNPGHYFVEAILPSGELLSEDVSIKSGQTHEVVLKSSDSPHEWLAWQQLSGNIPAKRPPARTATITHIRHRFEASQPGTGRQKFARYIHHDPDELLWGTASEPEVNVQAPLEWLTHPHNSLLTEGSARVWEFLAQLTSTSSTELISNLNSGKPSQKIEAAVSDAEHGVFRVNSEPGTAYGVVRLQKLPDSKKRTYLVIPRRRSVELLSIPLPWKVLAMQRMADIEIAVQEPADQKSFCSAAVVRDEKLGMLLGYLSTGALPTVRLMAETAKEMLYYKFDNPFAAAAGAYALVGTAQEAIRKPWHDWVSNLMKRFPYIPDGAIQLGTLRMRMCRDMKDLEVAVEAFKTAYSRGLPFYSLGMRWLLEGLEWGADRGDAEAKQMSDRVRLIAWRTNYNQPFTTLRIGGGADV